MADFVNYLLTELKAGRLARADVRRLLEQHRASVTSTSSRLHPLIDRAVGDVAAGRFVTEFSGDEFFLRDHDVNGQRILPGVAYLEMARAALALSAANSAVTLHDVAWLQPLVVQGSREVHLELSVDNFGTTQFKVQTNPEVVHACGRASISTEQTPVEGLDLAALTERCRTQVDAETCYSAFSAHGMQYGATHRALRQLHLGRDSAGLPFVMAQLSLPECVDTVAPFVLHPSVMDGALQACIGLFLDGQCGKAGTASRPLLPFSLERLDVLARSPLKGWALVRPASAAAPETQKFDIDICDDSGRVCVRFVGLISRAQKERAEIVETVTDTLSDVTVRYLTRLFAGVLQLPTSQIEAATGFERYGIDSLLALKLVGHLEETFGALPKTLLFEHQNLRDLARYFLENHRAVLAERLVRAPLLAAPPATPSAAASTRREPAATSRDASPHAAIAIIGMAGRYPQADNLDQYWENLRSGKDCITEIPPTRWDYRAHFDAEKGKPGKSYSKWGGFIDGVDEFDPLFFNISPAEAPAIDPQERLFLQCVYQTLEDAGYTRASLVSSGASEWDRTVGVFVGVMYEEYQLYGAQAQALGPGFALNGNPSSIANRVSYFCNFHGPSMAVDTMCSSSLTALHLACQSLRSGESDVAIAGGVNVSIHPNKYLTLAQGHFASSTGRCESFGRGGDGYVPGEGVGAVLLKPLDRAVQDGDRIHAVIRGTSVNHGGRTSGYTVPNPAAQAQVIDKALQDAGVDARTISYVEAHGTGTSLGDPIEVAGLAQAFSRYTQDRQFCAIGSAKSNIGHLESAAGIAALAKVVLQMKHRMLVPSLHSEILNPYIDFPATPFLVQQALAEWRAETSLIAGISSFGAGGANAHLIVEEYRAEPLGTVPAETVAIVLSARTSERLRVMAERLLAHVATQSYSSADLASIAYTLQVGREEFEHRLAFTAATVSELIAKLTGYLDGQFDKGEIEGGYRGEVASNREVLSALNVDEDVPRLIKAWIDRGKLDRLLQLWVKGLSFDWRALYVGQTPRRLNLPTYPFAQERYWVDTALTAARHQGEVRAAAALHPLVHRNSSDLDGQRFSSVLSGSSFYLQDHQIGGRKVLPAVCHLEMARAAVHLSSPGRAVAADCMRLEDVAWLRPVEVDDSLELNIALHASADGGVEFEIYSGEDVIHASGRALGSDPVPLPPVDLAGLQSRIERSIDPHDCYAAFTQAGIEYGPAHRGLISASIGRDHTDNVFVLARVGVPAPLSEADGQYVLHPSVMDCALQASVGVLRERVALPFSLRRLDIFAATPAQAWVIVRLTAMSSNAQELDIDVCDDAGHVCARMQGLTLRAIEPARAQGTLLAASAWVPASAVPSRAVAPGERRILLDPIYKVWASAIPAAVACLETQGSGGAIAEQVFASVQELLLSRPKGGGLLQVVAAADDVGALGALFRSAQLENPSFRGQIISLPPTATAAELVRALDENATTDAVEVSYPSGVRRVRQFRELVEPASNTHRPWKEGGVYLITGGAGGLGLIFAREILRSVADARVILTGRSELSADRLTEIRALNAGIEYQILDVTDPAAVQRCIDAVLEKHGRLNGIIHSAGVLRDNFIIKKTAQEFQAVLAPKLLGVMNLERATQTLTLDFLILFSSMAAAFGNAGQSDYAVANALMDSYVAQQKPRHGRTLSIRWPLWSAGGMKMAPAMQEAMRAHGLDTLSTAQGLQAFYDAWQSDEPLVLVLAGERARLRQLIGQMEVRAPAPAVDRDDLHSTAAGYLKALLARELNIPVDRIESATGFEQYGLSSIPALKLVNELERICGPLPKTLFFEYQNVAALASYFTEHFRDALTAHLRATQAAAPEAHPASRPEPRRARGGRRVALPFKPVATARDAAFDIAIVGLSGRYPQAKNLDEYWENLRSGKDCITEIPESRWDYRAYYDPEKGSPGKSYSKWGGFIDGVDEFDSLFFNISPQEARFMDPQERLFLQCVHQTLEDAGYTRQSLSAASGGDVGVYVGVMYEEYQLYGTTGSIAASIANRASYFCNFHGPSLVVNTMCSSSLAAIHLACESLKTGACQVALAGGVNVSIHPNKYLALAQGRFTSSVGRCESFGQGGDGYVPGEGVGAVLLKPMAKALEDRDHIYGVIKGTSLNHGGRTTGYTVPNPKAQADVIHKALRNAQVDPRTISYVEAHGTGTSLGDPIEIAGLTQAFAQSARQYCALGSVKSNIGHLESAAGIAALTKVLLQMRHRALVPSLHSAVLNPHVDFACTPFRVQQTLEPWNRPRLNLDGVEREYPLIAGVSSFGASGVNTHAIVAEYIDGAAEQTASTASATTQPALIVLSAKSRDGLQERVRQLLAHLDRHPTQDLIDVAYTLQVGREAMEYRLAFATTTVSDLARTLRSYLSEAFEAEETQDFYQGETRKHRETLSLFEDEAALQSSVTSWIEQGNYRKLLKLWVTGFPVDWEKLYGTVRPRRVPLPTYPFATTRHWISERPSHSSRRTQRALAPESEVTSHARAELERMQLQLLLVQLRASGLLVGEKLSATTVVTAAYGRWIDESVRILASVGFDEGGSWAAWEARKPEWMQNPDLRAQVVLVDATLKALPEMLLGKRAATDVLFPNSSMELVEGLYRRNATADFFNSVLADAVVEYIALRLQTDPGAKVRILEIGAGTGGTTAQLFDRLKVCEAAVAEYCYTDLSRAFLLHAEQTYRAAAPYLRCALFNVEQSPHAQGMDVGAYDLVIAANVFHATRNIRQTLRNAKATLKRGGLLLLNEVVARSVFTHLTFGLLDGWWRYEDASLRIPGTPAVAVETWTRVLDEEGFRSVLLPAIDALPAGQQIVVAESDGVVSQPEIAPAPARDVPSAAGELTGTLRIVPVWEAVSVKGARMSLVPSGAVVCIGGSDAQRAAVSSHFPTAVFLQDDADRAIEARVAQLEQQGTLDTVICFLGAARADSVAAEELITAQKLGVIHCFRIVKALLQLGYRTSKLNFYALTVGAHAITEAERIHPAHAGIDGLVGSLSKESRNWNVTSVDLQSADELPVRQLFSLPKSQRSHLWVYRNGQWYQHQLMTVNVSETRAATAWRRNGVYVVIGGAGQIGEALSEYLIREYQAQLVWIGRRPEDQTIRAKLARLGALGPAPQYISADASNREALESARNQIKEKHRHIHGIVQSAMVFSQRMLEEMTESEFETTLHSKVTTSVRMAQVFAGEPLDFVLFFSSLISFIKNAGQSHYAAGCTFEDAFAHQLRNEWRCEVKVMNWGFWGVGGTISTQDSRLDDIGLAAIEPREAMEALEELMVGSFHQAALIRTTRAVPIEGLTAGEIVCSAAQTAPAISPALWLTS